MIGRRVRSCRWAGPGRCSRVTLSCWSAWLVIEVGQIEECYLSRASELLLVPLRTGFVMNTGVLAPVPAGARVNSFWNFSLDVRMLPEAVTVTSRRQLIASRQQRSGRCMKHLDLVLLQSGCILLGAAVLLANPMIGSRDKPSSSSAQFTYNRVLSSVSPSRRLHPTQTERTCMKRSVETHTGADHWTHLSPDGRTGSASASNGLGPSWNGK
jgi:hypothetical protein